MEGILGILLIVLLELYDMQHTLVGKYFIWMLASNDLICSQSSDVFKLRIVWVGVVNSKASVIMSVRVVIPTECLN